MALLALLLTWSASLPAQGNDPFPSVNVNKYADNMTILGQVRINGRVLGEGTVIAVYQGDEIRGKGTPFSQDKHENIFYFNVYGDQEGEPLHFRVFTDGSIIEVDQGLTYKADLEVGSPSSYYVVNLPAPIVTTFNEDGWATTYLPFKAKVPDGVKVWDVTEIYDGIVQKELLPGTVLPAQTPVLLQSSLESCKWDATVADASITRSAESILRGTLTEMKVYSYRDLTLGYSNANPPQVGFWPFTGNLEANRAYILISSGGKGGQLTDDGQTTLIRDLEVPAQDKTSYYDLMGRKTTLRKGQILISNGKKILQR